MRVDAINPRAGQTRNRIEQLLGWLVAVVPVVVGVATIDVSAVDPAPQVLKTDADAQRAARAPDGPGEGRSTPAGGDLDRSASVHAIRRNDSLALRADE